MEKIKNFLFKNQTTKQTIVKNFFWVSLGVSLSKILKSIVIIYAARILGVEGYGIFTYALSFVAVFNIFSDLGLSNLLTRDLIKRDDKENYLATALSIKIVLSVATLIFIGFVSPIFTNIEEAKPLMLIVAILITFDGLRSFIFSIYRSMNRMQFEAFFEILTEVIITISCIAVLFKIPSVLNFSLAYMLASGAGFILTLLFTSKYISNIIKNFKRKLLLPIVKSAWPFTVVGVFGVLMTSIDSVIIGFLKPVQDLGLFGAAQRPISIIYLIPGFMYTALLPFFSKFAEDKEKLSKFTTTSIVISLGLAMPIVVGGAILAKPIINVIYGYNFIESANVFRILLLTMIPIFPGMILSAILLAKDKQKIFIRSTFFGAIANIILDFLLIPKYGIEGSAWATVVTQMIANSILFYEVNRNIELRIWSRFKKIIFSLLVMTTITLVLKAYSVPLVLIFIASAITYFCMLIALKDKTLEEIKTS